MWKTTKAYLRSTVGGLKLERFTVMCIPAMELAHAVGNFHSLSPNIGYFVWKVAFLSAMNLAWWRHYAIMLRDHRRFAEIELQSGARAESISLSVRPVWASENWSSQLLIAYSICRVFPDTVTFSIGHRNHFLFSWYSIFRVGWYLMAEDMLFSEVLLFIFPILSM
jgi:hypothetical protein